MRITRGVSLLVVCVVACGGSSEGGWKGFGSRDLDKLGDAPQIRIYNEVPLVGSGPKPPPQCRLSVDLDGKGFEEIAAGRGLTFARVVGAGEHTLTLKVVRGADSLSADCSFYGFGPDDPSRVMGDPIKLSGTTSGGFQSLRVKVRPAKGAAVHVDVAIMDPRQPAYATHLRSYFGADPAAPAPVVMVATGVRTCKVPHGDCPSRW